SASDGTDALAARAESGRVASLRPERRYASHDLQSRSKPNAGSWRPEVIGAAHRGMLRSGLRMVRHRGHCGSGSRTVCTRTKRAPVWSVASQAERGLPVRQIGVRRFLAECAVIAANLYQVTRRILRSPLNEIDLTRDTEICQEFGAYP